MTPTHFISQCQACVANGGASTEVAALVRLALASQKEEPAWRDLDEFMFRSRELLIVNLTIPPFSATPVHDHGMWAVVGISSGCEVNRFFSRNGHRLRQDEEVMVSAGNTIELSAEVIHSIFNPLDTETRGIHVYGGDLISASRRMWHPQTQEEFVFEGNVFEAWCKELTDAATPFQGGANGA
jgi:predicted metal-dependent enzyme (double-stranded beta helix superfamily)